MSYKSLLLNSYGLAAAMCFAAADVGSGNAGGAAPAAPKTGKSADAGKEVNGFKIETGIELPPRTRLGGGGDTTNYPFKEMPVGASFLTEVNVPATITDAKERDKAFKEEARKVSNKLSGAIRRFKKSNDGYNFAIRTVDGGVRVWRVEADKA